MAKKIKEYGKVINDNPAAMEIYLKQKSLYNEAEELERENDNYFCTYSKMEGMYSIGTVTDPWGGQGMRGYGYKYPSQEVRLKEEAEREAYYTTYIKPLKEKIEELRKQARALEEPLCVAVCGYGVEEYRVRTWLAEAEKDLTRQIEYVERLKKQLKEIENRD